MKSCVLIVTALLSLGLAKIKVYSPKKLKEWSENMYENGEIPASLANFGNPPYGT
jgi:hypothetical protein